MIISTDGACKRLGKPDCFSVGAAWIHTDEGALFLLAKPENNSTSQRGEINGLLVALDYVVEHAKPDEDIIIITDSEYLHNTVMKEWCFKWRDNDWIIGTGEPAKNRDKWELVCNLLDRIGKDRVYLNWTKGHLLSYSKNLTERSIREDATGVSLFGNLTTIANRPSEKQRIADEFNSNRINHDYSKLPEQTAVDWVVMNVMADCIATCVVTLLDVTPL